jgi:hypothetical protein
VEIEPKHVISSIPVPEVDNDKLGSVDTHKRKAEKKIS